ncbi:MAG: peptidoglycan bridge formation glycyltransferase FemA/FemB family protein [Clostridia bacterium]|nr:peptidoglycan bridge formation glycyltransferase FemA/FemB family protein [Clostridia bacterium]
MFEFVNEQNLPQFEAFVQSHPKGHFLQSHDWAPVKSDWKWEGILRRNEAGEITGAMSVLLRKMPGVPYQMMYAARGPVCDLHDADTLRELTQGAAVLAKKYKAYALRIDPDVSSSDTEFIELMKSLGYVHHPGDKDFNGIQPCYVFRLNVKDKTEDELLAAFHSKTRYNLRLSARKGVTVRVCGKEMLPDFARLMQETGNRDGFITRPQAYFETMMDALGENARLYMAFWEDRPIAGTLAVHYGNKVWYLYGASSNQHRNVMPNYQLQWEMIRWALETGAEIYDFRGVSGDLTPDNPLYGLYLFKKGFGGDLVEFCGEFEMVYNKTADLLVNKGLGAARTLRRKIKMLAHRSEEQQHKNAVSARGANTRAEGQPEEKKD